MRRLVPAALTVALACAASFASSAQDFPNKPLRVLIPFAPGGVADTSTRILTTKMTPRLGWTFAVDNRPGGNGSIAVGLAARAGADPISMARRSCMRGSSALSKSIARLRNQWI